MTVKMGVIALVVVVVLSHLLHTSILYRRLLCLSSYVCIVSSGQTDIQFIVRHNKKFIKFKTEEFNKFSDCMSSRWISSCSAITSRKRTDVTSSVDKVSHTTRNDSTTGIGVKQCSVWTNLVGENVSTTEITCQYTGSHRCDITITVNSAQNRSVAERKSIVFSLGWGIGAYHYFDITDYNRGSIRVEKCETARSKILRPTALRYAVWVSGLFEITVSTTAVRKYNSDSSTNANEAKQISNGATILPTTSGAATRLTNDLGSVLMSQGTPSSRSQGNATPEVSLLKLTVVVLALALSVFAVTVTAGCICRAWRRRVERIGSPLYCSPLRDEHRRDSHVYTALFNGDSASAGQGLDLHFYDVIQLEEDGTTAQVNRAQEAHAASTNID